MVILDAAERRYMLQRSHVGLYQQAVAAEGEAGSAGLMVQANENH